MRLLLGLAALAGTAIMTVKAMQARKRNDETGQQEEAEPIEAHPIDVEEDLDEEAGTGVFWGYAIQEGTMKGEVAPGIILGSYTGLLDYYDPERMQRLGVTHLINCTAGSQLDILPCWPGMKNVRLPLTSSSQVEEALPLLPLVFSQITEARGKGGKVLLFCEGTECRMSSFFALAHMHSFDDNNLGRLYTMYCDLHNMPGVEPPTLPEVHKLYERRSMLEDPPAVRVQLVMRSGSNTVIRPWTGDLSPAMLRPDWAMIVQIRKGQVIWQGSQCPEREIQGAELWAGLEQEHALKLPPSRITEGQETDELRSLFGLPPSTAIGPEPPTRRRGLRGAMHSLLRR